MSSRSILMISRVPTIIKGVFSQVDDPNTPEEKLWRERAARMTLDALGYTHITTKPMRHNDTVRYARRWFRGLYESLPDESQEDSAPATFDSGGIVGFTRVKNAVLAFEPLMFPERDVEVTT